MCCVMGYFGSVIPMDELRKSFSKTSTRGPDAEEVIKTLTDYFSQIAEIDTVLLFGSFAKGCYTERSDIDIAIHSDKPLDYERLATIQTDLALLTHHEIDLADLSKAKGFFLYQIMTTGIKINISRTVFVKYLSLIKINYYLC